MSTRKNRAFDAAQPTTGRHHPTLALSAIAAALLAGCGGSDAGLPQLTAAQPATLQSCATLANSLALPDTRITSSELVAEGGLTATGVTTPIPAHCLVKGTRVRHQLL